MVLALSSQSWVIFEPICLQIASHLFLANSKKFKYHFISYNDNDNEKNKTNRSQKDMKKCIELVL